MASPALLQTVAAPEKNYGAAWSRIMLNRAGRTPKTPDGASVKVVKTDMILAL